MFTEYICKTSLARHLKQVPQVTKTAIWNLIAAKSKTEGPCIK